MKNHKHQSGQSLIEFALLLPVFLLLVIGFFDIGRAVFYYSSLTNAVREATRFAIVNPGAINDEWVEIEQAKITGECCVDDGIQDNPLKLKVLEYGIGIKEGMINPCCDIVIVIDQVEIGFKSVSIEVTLNYEPITPILRQIVGEIPLVVQSKMEVAPGLREE